MLNNICISKYFFKFFVVTSILFSIFFFGNQRAEAYVGPFIKFALKADELNSLAEHLRKNNGTKVVGKILGKRKYTESQLEDVYLQLVLKQGRVTKSEAEQFHRTLKGIPGYRTTLRKITGNNESLVKGHLNELRIASKASQHKFEVVAIGQKFKDPLKKGQTDIDILLTKNGKSFAIETKTYVPSKINFRNDVETLVNYEKKNPHSKLNFTISDPNVSISKKDTYQKIAHKKGVKLIFGKPEILVHKIELLEKII